MGAAEDVMTSTWRATAGSDGDVPPLAPEGPPVGEPSDVLVLSTREIILQNMSTNSAMDVIRTPVLTDRVLAPTSLSRLSEQRRRPFLTTRGPPTRTGELRRRSAGCVATDRHLECAQVSDLRVTTR